MANRIDFKWLKEHADFLKVLAHYQIKVTGSGVSRSIHCPFHKNDKEPSCKINLGRKGYHCFSCDAHGNVLTFVQHMEGLKDDELRAAARKLADICGLELAPPSGTPAVRKKPAQSDELPAETMKEPSDGVSPHSEPSDASGEVSPDEVTNAPLGEDFVTRFRAKLTDQHPTLASRGLRPETLKAFGVAFFAADKGMMKNRVVIPIHDEKGQLLAWVGRWVGPDEELPAGQGKYLFPAKFHKNQVLYNLHRVKRDIWHSGLVTIVEGYWSVMTLFELGIPAVALMGRTLSARQLDLLTTLRTQRVTVLLDGDEPGYEASAKVAAQLADAGILTKALYLPAEQQPDTFLLKLRADDPERLEEWLSAIRWS